MTEAMEVDRLQCDFQSFEKISVKARWEFNRNNFGTSRYKILP